MTLESNQSGWERGGAAIFVICCVGFFLAGCGPAGRNAHPPAATAAATPAALPRASADNLLSDPGFEAGAAQWIPYQKGLLERTQAQHHSGKWALRVTLGGPPAPFGLWASNAVANPGKGERYAVSTWVRPTAVSTGLRLIVTLYEVGGVRPARQVAWKIAVLHAGWQRVGAVGRVHNHGRTALQVYVFVQSTIAAGDGFYVDDAQLRLLSKPTAR